VLAGRLIAGRYQVERTVSVGANTIVVDATDTQLGRLVTLKLIRPEFSEDDDFRRRFDQTMRAMSVLSHPNVAAIFDWGETTLGNRTTVFAVVEYMGAGSLRDLFDRGRLLTPSQALVVGLDACRALDYAHRRGVVHSEVTPSKLVFGDDRRLRVIDFGLARLLGMAAWRDPATIATHTARYASPEQPLGQPIDGKSDVYALALCLSEAVTGNVPFAADSTMATLSGRVGKLMPVSAELGSLAAVLERAGRPERTDRWTAAEFGRALVGAAEKLPRPEPMPLVTASIFTDQPTRRPTDPTGGIDRPTDPLASMPEPEPEPAPEPVPEPVPSPVPGPAPEAVAEPLPAPEAVTAAEPVGGQPQPTQLVPPTSTAATEAPPEPVTAAKRRRVWPRLAVALLLAATLAGLGVAAYLLFKVDKHPVPDLAGQDEAAAAIAVEEFDWEIERTVERSDEVPTPGDVIRTSPPAGEQLAEGEPLLLVVSEGPEFRSLPNLQGLTDADARTALAELRLQSSQAERAFHERIPPGSVVSWQVVGDAGLKAGDDVLPGTEVALTLSKGPRPRRVPDLRGASVAQATTRLDELGLALQRGDDIFSNDIAKDLIVRQRPAPDRTVERGATITVRVSKGPDFVRFPDLEGRRFRGAVDRLERAGLRLGSVLGSTLGTFQRARVDGSTIEPGEQVVRGTRVDLVFF
jgi:beta-lactam-binding protein with PASTA domain/serine/threonine protein kinase